MTLTSPSANPKLLTRDGSTLPWVTPDPMLPTLPVDTSGLATIIDPTTGTAELSLAADVFGPPVDISFGGGTATGVAPTPNLIGLDDPIQIQTTLGRSSGGSLSCIWSLPISTCPEGSSTQSFNRSFFTMSLQWSVTLERAGIAPTREDRTLAVQSWRWSPAFQLVTADSQNESVGSVATELYDTTRKLLITAGVTESAAKTFFEINFSGDRLAIRPFSHYGDNSNSTDNSIDAPAVIAPDLLLFWSSYSPGNTRKLVRWKASDGTLSSKLAFETQDAPLRPVPIRVGESNFEALVIQKSVANSNSSPNRKIFLTSGLTTAFGNLTRLESPTMSTVTEPVMTFSSGSDGIRPFYLTKIGTDWKVATTPGVATATGAIDVQPLGTQLSDVGTMPPTSGTCHSGVVLGNREASGLLHVSSLTGSGLSFTSVNGGRDGLAPPGTATNLPPCILGKVSSTRALIYFMMSPSSLRMLYQATWLPADNSVVLEYISNFSSTDATPYSAGIAGNGGLYFVGHSPTGKRKLFWSDGVQLNQVSNLVSGGDDFDTLFGSYRDGSLYVELRNPSGYKKLFRYRPEGQGVLEQILDLSPYNDDNYARIIGLGEAEALVLAFNPNVQKTRFLRVRLTDI